MPDKIEEKRVQLERQLKDFSQQKEALVNQLNLLNSNILRVAGAIGAFNELLAEDKPQETVTE